MLRSVQSPSARVVSFDDVSWSEIRTSPTKARCRCVSRRPRPWGTAMWSMLRRFPIWRGERAVGTWSPSRSTVSSADLRPAAEPVQSLPDRAWFQCPPQIVGSADSAAARAAMVFPAVLVPTQGSREPQEGHGRIEEHLRRPSTSAIAEAQSGPGRGSGRIGSPRFGTQQQASAVQAVPGSPTRSDTSVSSSTSQSIASMRARNRASQRSARFQVPMLTYAVSRGRTPGKSHSPDCSSVVTGCPGGLLGVCVIFWGVAAPGKCRFPRLTGGPGDTGGSGKGP